MTGQAWATQARPFARAALTLAHHPHLRAAHPCPPQLPVLLYLPPTSAALLLHLWWFSKWLKCGGSKKGAKRLE